MAYNIGVNVVEVDGAGAPSITGAAVSVGAFNVTTQRGIPNQPVRVTGFPGFVEHFGGHFTGGLGAYLVKGFFDNGGQTAYVNRVVDTTPATGASPATLTLPDSANNATLTLGGGFRGQVDPGTWGRQVFVRTRSSSSAQSRVKESAPATVPGSALTSSTVDMSSFPALLVRIDGAPTATELKFAARDFANPAAATREEIRDAINRQTHLLVASVGGSANNALVLTSTGERATLTGDWSALQVTAANTTLGFSLMAQPVKGTPVALTGGGTQLAKAGGFAAGDAVVVADGTTTARVKLLSVNEATGAVTWTPAVNPTQFTDPRLITVANAEFDLIVASGAGNDEHTVETYTGLSMETDLPNYVVRVLNHTLTGSRFVQATDVGTAGPVVDRPAPTAGFVPLQGGADGTPTANHFIGDAAARTGFHAFDPFNVQLVCCERTDAAIARAGLDYCARRDDAMYVGAVPKAYVGGGQAVAYGQALQAKKAYGALYGPWVVVPDPIGVGDSPRVVVPPVGHVMGVYARTETARGIWKAPAGDEANLLGVLDVETRLSDADHTDLVVNGCVNGVRAQPGAGIVVDASRTLSTDPRWRYVNVRLLFNYVKSSLRDGLRWVRQEPNRDTLWDAVKHSTVVPFLTGLWRQGAFGTGTPDQTFTVVVDATNNPPDQVEQGRLTVEVYFYPARPAETIVIVVGQQPSGGTAREQ
ncbi:phage tail sheath family protein [Streptomyces melanogenes]|uniref:phage tail sheath family protein n=1 Tax=Streptomyces melanogenes TaxID=67326 RepID=UPI0037A153E0